MQKRVLSLLAVSCLMISTAQAADLIAGKAKASALCAGCHGDSQSIGVFMNLQLAGRNADKLAIKTNKFRTGKLFTPLMAPSMIGLSEKDVEDITAYYASVKRPYEIPLIQVRGDDESSKL